MKTDAPTWMRHPAADRHETDSGSQTVKPVTLVALALVLAIGLMSWRQSSLEAELAGLRATWEKARAHRLAAASTHAPLPSMAGSAFPSDPSEEPVSRTPVAAAGKPSPDRAAALADVLEGHADVMEMVLKRLADWDEKARQREAARQAAEQLNTIEFEGFINYGEPIQTTRTNLGDQSLNLVLSNFVGDEGPRPVLTANTPSFVTLSSLTSAQSGRLGRPRKPGWEGSQAPANSQFLDLTRMSRSTLRQAP